MVALAKIPVSMSVAEFLAWEPGDGRAWQLVDGEPHAMAPASRTHGTIQGQLSRLIGNHLATQGGRCSVVVAPGVVPHVNAGSNMRVPDLAVTCSPYTAEEHALTDPVLIIEIVSPSNQSETWTSIWAYTSIPSVQEILVLRTAMVGADLLRRDVSGNWPRDPERVDRGELVLRSIGFSVPIIDIYEGTRLVR